MVVNVSTRIRYALRMLVDIAAFQELGKVKIKDISARQDISVKYLEQIVTILSKADIVKGERGPQGGYVLARPASDITVAEVVTSIEGTLAPVPCIKNGRIDCQRKDRCTTLDMWLRIEKAISEIMTETTIQDLLDDANSKGIIRIQDPMPEYVI
ncbi:MAG: Rrf2 family transcriptional regulator [Candidatus Methanomethylophilus sp.]|nr:Rrf2 family transcriptional regulator [Methanomethylophilus sp.]